jgi:hypothetical protein
MDGYRSIDERKSFTVSILDQLKSDPSRSAPCCHRDGWMVERKCANCSDTPQVSNSQKHPYSSSPVSLPSTRLYEKEKGGTCQGDGSL